MVVGVGDGVKVGVGCRSLTRSLVVVVLVVDVDRIDAIPILK